MQKIEYGDLYKFLVSVGVILIGFAVLIPYFYLKEDFGLCVPQSDMARFEPEVRQIIRTKQQLLLRVQNYVPYLSLAMFATGILSVAAGLYKWSRRQRQADAKFDLEVNGSTCRYGRFRLRKRKRRSPARWTKSPGRNPRERKNRTSLPARYKPESGQDTSANTTTSSGRLSNRSRNGCRTGKNTR